MTYKILHFDNSEIIKEGFRQIVTNQSYLDASLEIIESNKTIISELDQYNPDIVIINLDNISKIIINEVLNYVNIALKKAKIILVSNIISESSFSCFYNKGVLGFLYLNSKKDEIINCIKKVCSSDRYVSKKFQEGFKNNSPHNKSLIQNFENLTSKELDVIELIILGKTSNEIALQLHNSKRTIETHRQHISEKLDIIGQGRLTLFLIEHKTLITDLLNNSPRKKSKLIMNSTRE